jgi:hypothetical protein
LFTGDVSTSLHRLDARRNAQIHANLSCELLFNFTVTWNSRGRTVRWIAINGMSAAFAHKKAAVRLKVPDEVGSFHVVDE